MERREQERDLTTEDIAGASRPADDGTRPAGPQSPIEDSGGPQAPTEGQTDQAQGRPGPQAPLAPQAGLEREQGIHPQPATDPRPGEETQPAAPPGAAGAAGPGPEAETTTQPLLQTGDADGFHRRWESIQIGFVDDPRRAVADADALVAEVIRRLAETFSEERSRLEGHWGRGEDVPTDDLRLTLQRYRSFFHRLLST